MAKTKLKDLEVTEVSLVDAGANQHAHVALYKRNGGKPEEQPTGQNPEQAPAKSGLHKFGMCALHWKTACAALSGTKK